MLGKNEVTDKDVQPIFPIVEMLANSGQEEDESSIDISSGFFPDVETAKEIIKEEVPKKTTLTQGKTLRLLAEEYYGNREFWVYIYLENKGKIPNPHKVASGIVLDIPHKSAYFIDAENPHSVANAITLGNEVLKLMSQ